MAALSGVLYTGQTIVLEIGLQQGGMKISSPISKFSEQARLKKLRQYLVELCRAGGPIPFALYMELCLYHPQLGYYSAGPPPMGKKGDYLTYPSVHPAFGRLLGRQVAEIWRLMGKPCGFTLVEMGGGEGLLCRDMLEMIREEAPDLFQELLVVVVDRSPKLLRIQEETLGNHAKVRAMGIEEFFSLEPLVGCVVSNELVDAMPVHLVEMRCGELQEVLVEVGQEEIREVLAPPTDARIPEYFKALGANPPEGGRAEVALAAWEWMQKVAQCLEKGVVITMDFGYSGQEAFHPLRLQGTLMAYKGHLASPNPYELPGGQDLCAHVNFQALTKAGEQEGLVSDGLVPQDRFLWNLGLLQEMEALEARRTEMSAASFWAQKLALRKLMMPQPPRGGFQVMCQRKGWEHGPLTGWKGEL